MTIHVLCLNPAIDKIYEIEDFAAGEDYPGQRPGIQIGGKGVNVARVLSQLGARVRLYAFLGEMGAEDFRREMQPRCDCMFITVPGACRTTVNIIDRKNGKETVITEAGPHVEEKDVQALLDALSDSLQAGDMLCCSGSIIAGASADIYARAAKICAQRGAFCALDCNVQALPASLEGAHYALGKPNERELCALLGSARTQEPREIAGLARQMLDKYDALLVSLGAQGGVWVDQDRAYFARIPQETVISTVGSGDAALAGALMGASRRLDPQQTLRLAMACGVANAMIRETGSVRCGDVERIYKQIEIKSIG